MIETVILQNLLHNEDYTRRVIPYLKAEYFPEQHQAKVFTQISEFVNTYNKLPTQEELIVELTSDKSLNQTVYDQTTDLVKELSKRSKEPALEWLLTHTEQFCQDKALYNAIVDSVAVMDGQDTGSLKSGIPDMIRTALAVSFDNAIGHDWADYSGRYELLHETLMAHMPFDIDVLNKITGGGLSKKTLSVISAMTGAGKTLVMCHFAARTFLAGSNVLYITLEMSEERIGERVDANLLGVDLDALAVMPKDEYAKRMQKILDTCDGRLIIKEFPTACAGVAQFRSLLNELKLKKGFVPDLVIVDYINICSSSRFKASAVNSYQYIKAICEELRGLAIEFNLPIFSATQLNRDAVDSSDVGLGEISESHGLAMTVDILWALIRTEELDDQGLVMFKQLKNRFSDIASLLRFVVGIDRAKMKLYNAGTSSLAQHANGIVSNGSPAAANAPSIGARGSTAKSSTNRDKFNTLKV